jgi:hypothetical protein
MTTTKLLRLRGAGGKKPKNPTYTNDNLFSEDSIELLLGVGEGPIKGLENGAKSFFVGDVPLERVEGASTIKNFANLIINPNALNDTGQGVDYHNGFPEGIAHDVVFQKGGTSASVEVGTRVLYSTPVIRYTPSNMRGRIKKLEVRVNIAQLGIEDSNGTRNNTAKFRIEYKTSDPNSLWTILDAAYSFPLLPAAKSLAVVSSSREGENEYQLEGKTGSGFIIDFTIPANPLATLPPQFEQDWMIRVTKNSPDYLDGGSATKEIAEIIFDSFQMIGDARMDFPNTAVIHVLGTASDQFSSLPDFYGIYKGLITPVPVGYDTTRADPHEFVTWTGALENKYHSNPAWVLYDLLNNERYGYRKYVSDLNLNKQDFYEAGIWCDSQVLGDNLQSERRYTMNITIAENQNAWDYLQNIAGAFDGILYDDGEGTVRLKVDKWVEPKIIFTPETINAEGFAYSFTDVATQYNELTVSYVNPARGWEESRTVVSYGKSDASIDNGQAVNGVIPLDFVAVGCITESEAKRRGRVRALTASTENTLINFTTTRLGLALDPLEIFYVADPYMDWGQTGRAEVISGRNIYLRDELPWTVTDLSVPYQMRIQTLSDVLLCDVLLLSPTSLLVIDPISSGAVAASVFDNAHFAEFPVFVLSGGRIHYGQPKPFRATTLEPTNNYNLFNISGLEVNPRKFDIIGDGVNISLSIIGDRLSGLNLRSYFRDTYIAPENKFQTVTIVLDGTQQAITSDFLLITAADVNSYALMVGDWSDILPPMVKPKLVIKGNVKILGRGGKGGDGGALMGIDTQGGGLASFTLPPDYGFPTGSLSVMGGQAGQNGGPAANFESLLDLEIQVGATLEISGGYGGGYGGDGCYVAVPAYLTGFGIRASASRELSIFRLCGAGGSGGRPFGAAGAAGATNYGVSSGTVGLKGTGGICPDRQLHPVVQTGLLVKDGEGHDGLPVADTNDPSPEFVINPTNGHTNLYTYAGSRVNGSQGVAITNYGNVNITGSGRLIITP